MKAPNDTPPDKKRGNSGLTRSERIALLFFFVLAIGYVIWQFYNRSKVSVELGEDIVLPIHAIVVQVEGAVEVPGMVELPSGARVSDAIEAAGGFTSLADRNSVNLAEVLEDGQRVDVPRLEGGRDRAEDQGGFIRPIFLEPNTGSSGDDVDESDGGLVNINTADMYRLDNLPGIGEQLAARIIEYRETNGPFERIEDIMEVEGIGEGKFEDLRDLISVGNY